MYKIQITKEFILFLVSTNDAAKYHLVYLEFLYREKKFEICKTRIHDFSSSVVDLIAPANKIFALSTLQVFELKFMSDSDDFTTETREKIALHEKPASRQIEQSKYKNLKFTCMTSSWSK